MFYLYQATIVTYRIKYLNEGIIFRAAHCCYRTLRVMIRIEWEREMSAKSFSHFINDTPLSR